MACLSGSVFLALAQELRINPGLGFLIVNSVEMSQAETLFPLEIFILKTPNF